MGNIEITAENARLNLLERENELNAAMRIEPLTWSQSFPDPTTHPEEAKAFAVKAINDARRDAAYWKAIAQGVMAEAFALLDVK